MKLCNRYTIDILFYRFNDWSCISEISNIKLIIRSLTAMFWHLDGYYLKNRPSNFAESWYNGSSSETIKIFQASLFIMLNLWSSANVHPFAVSHIIMLLNKYLCHIIHWYSTDDSIYHKYIHLVILLSSLNENYIFTDLLQNIITIIVPSKKKNQRRGNAGLMLIKLMERTLYSTQKSISQLVNVSSF